MRTVSGRKRRTCTAAAALVAAVALAGCAQSYLQGAATASSTKPPSSDNIFDWLDSNAPETRRGQATQGAPGGTGPTNAEIYYGTNVAGLGRSDSADVGNSGRIVTAGLDVGGPFDNGMSRSGLRAQNDGRAQEQGVTRAPGNSLNVNFENADIKAVTRAILGDILNLNYAIDPRITGTLTLYTRRPIARQQLLPLLEDALRAQGAAIVKQNEIYRILPDKEATGLGRTNVGRNAGDAGFGITALPLENISADALSKILDGFGAPPRSVRIDPDRNLLIIQGTYSEREQLIDTAMAFDVDWMRNQSVGVFPVRNANPDVVIGELNKMVDANSVRFQAIDRMNAILAVSRSPQAIRQVSTWISRLDRINNAGVRVRVYRLKHADARRIATLIREVFGIGGSGQLQPEAGQLVPGSEGVTARVAAAPTAGIGTGTQSDAQSDAGRVAAPDAAPIEAGSGNRKIRVTADTANNAIVVHADQQDSLLIERAIQELDRAPVQVSIEATIAEITLTDALNNGVQFYFAGKWGSVSQSRGALPLGRVVPGANLVLGNEATPRLVLDALREITDVKVLSSPSLVVVDNQPAILQVGDQVPVTTRSAQDVTNPTAPIVNSIDFRDTGVILRVTPRVHANSMIGIEIEQEISAVKEGAPNSETLTPTISQRRVKSTVSVADNQTLLLGGLISEQRTKGKSGIPGVVDIPVLGNILAGQHNDGNTRTELIIFIKPQVVRNTIDARRVAEDLRRRMKGFERW